MHDIFLNEEIHLSPILIKNQTAKVCSVLGCLNKIYSRDLCKAHYELKRRFGRLFRLTEKNNGQCRVDGCLKKSHLKGFCCKHYQRNRKGMPLEPLDLRRGAPGDRNGNWRGGTSEYPNHYQMKCVRKQKIKDSNGRCTICGSAFEPPYSELQVHHIDGSKDNHLYDNLLIACPKCSKKFHKGRPYKTSKIIREYGLSLKQMAERFGGKQSKYWFKHRAKTLHSFLERNHELF